MRILVAVDPKSYSAHAVNEVARLAGNTWADVTLLGIQSGAVASSPPDLSGALRGYRADFLGHFDKEDCPYIQRRFGYRLVEVKKGIWEELYVAQGARKNLRARIRRGTAVKQILAEAREEESDLIVLGCDTENEATWADGGPVPQKVAYEAPCSVLVVKEEKKVNRIVCCLDHDRVSQESLEMINQLVTLHKAGLQIVALTTGESIKTEVEHKVDAVMRYYRARGVEPWVEMVEISAFDAFISQEAHWGLMALWMGKKSVLEKVLSRNKVNRLIKGSESSVLILR